MIRNVLVTPRVSPVTGYVNPDTVANTVPALEIMYPVGVPLGDAGADQFKVAVVGANTFSVPLALIGSTGTVSKLTLPEVVDSLAVES